LDFLLQALPSHSIQADIDGDSVFLPAETFAWRKASFDHFPGKAELELRRNFENLRAVSLWIHYVIIYFLYAGLLIGQIAGHLGECVIGQRMVHVVEYARLD
jgi:hypothetical protein